MKNLRRFFAVMMAGLMITAPSFAADAKDLAGKYTVRGTDPAGNKYEGAAEITHKRGPTVEITWKIGKRNWIGLGRLTGNVLTVEYQGAIADREGKATYDVKPMGRLVGKWHTKNQKGVGSENLIPER